MDTEFKIGIYIRLSMADGDTGHAKAESDSIGNQRLLMNRFLDEHPELAGCPRQEFVDDGYTGTNFQRPQFIEMMKRLCAGEINLICVKDFSRFSRDYIELGYYLEYVFPFLRIRFISVNDGYDSKDYQGTTGGLEVVMRSIIYASYSKDLSVKTTTAKIHMMKQGKYVGGYAPYGYTLHPTVRNKLALDADAAAVVRRIFDEALAGRNTSQIAAGLNRDRVPTPGQYFRDKHPDCGKFKKMSGKISWTAATVYKILTNYVYTGATVGHTRRSAGLGTRKSIAQDREDWIVVEGMHEAIINKDEFEQAQSVIRGGVKKPERTVRDYALKGLVRCGNCGRVMVRRRLRPTGEAYFTCPYAANKQEDGCAAGERHMEAELEHTAYHAINQFAALAERQAAQSKKSNLIQMDAVRKHLGRLKELQVQVEQLKASKLRWYDRYINEEISKSEYLKLKAEADQKLLEYEADVQREQERISDSEASRSCLNNEVDALCRKFTVSEALTAELARAFIKAIYIHGTNRIEIKWKFEDIFHEREGETVNF